MATYIGKDGRELTRKQWRNASADSDYFPPQRQSDKARNIETEVSWVGVVLIGERRDQAGLWCCRWRSLHPDTELGCEFFPTLAMSHCRANALLSAPLPVPLLEAPANHADVPHCG